MQRSRVAKRRWKLASYKVAGVGPDICLRPEGTPDFPRPFGTVSFSHDQPGTPLPHPLHEPAVGRDIALRCPAAQSRLPNVLPASCRKIKYPRTAQRAVPTRFRGSRREPCSGNSLPALRWRGEGTEAPRLTRLSPSSTHHELTATMDPLSANEYWGRGPGRGGTQIYEVLPQRPISLTFP